MNKFALINRVVYRKGDDEKELHFEAALQGLNDCCIIESLLSWLACHLCITVARCDSEFTILDHTAARFLSNLSHCRPNKRAISCQPGFISISGLFVLALMQMSYTDRYWVGYRAYHSKQQWGQYQVLFMQPWPLPYKIRNRGFPWNVVLNLNRQNILLDKLEYILMETTGFVLSVATAVGEIWTVA